MKPIILEFAYPPPLARRVFLSYVWRLYAGFLLGWTLVTVVLLLLLWTGEARLLATFGLGMVCARTLSFARTWRLAGRVTGPPGAELVSVELSEEGVRVRSKGSEWFQTWSAIRVVLRLREAWLLAHDTAQSPLPIPTAVLTAEARERIEESVRAVGGSLR